jgi:hypothetical protein
LHVVVTWYSKYSEWRFELRQHFQALRYLHVGVGPLVSEVADESVGVGRQTLGQRDSMANEFDADEGAVMQISQQCDGLPLELLRQARKCDRLSADADL